MRRPADTSAQARETQLAAFRAMGAAARLRAALEMSEDARRLALAGCRARHPDWPDDEVRRAVAELLLGPELASRVLAAAPR